MMMMMTMTMMLCKRASTAIVALSLALCAATVATAGASSPIHRRLELENICRYSPNSKVTDENALDLDQEMIRDRLSLGQIVKARNVYQQGGHSQSTARLTIATPPGTPYSFPAGTRVYGPTHGTGLGTSAYGVLREETTWQPSSSGQKFVPVEVEYFTSEVQSLYSNCHAGGLVSFQQADLDGCFADSGALEFVNDGQEQGMGVQFNYTYDVRHDNINYRTLQSLSTNAKDTMKSCADCDYHEDFQKFVDYYGDEDYADKWVMAASLHEPTFFSSGRGDANFTGMAKIGVAEAMLAGTVFLNLFMYVIHEVEDSMAGCDGSCMPGLGCQEDPIHALDRAVAFYCGSLEGEYGNGEGVFQYAIANHRAKDFKTAGETRNKTHGTANANQDIISQFIRAKLSLGRKNCEASLNHRKAILTSLKIPVIQAVLRMAYIRDFEDLNEELTDKAEGAGATFAAAILPFVYACDQDDADTIFRSMKIGSKESEVSFSSVKAALERNYACLGVTCTDIGGLWEEDKYAAGSEPCTHIVSLPHTGEPTIPLIPQDSSTSSTANQDNGGGRGNRGGKAATVIMILTVVGLMVGFFGYRRVVVRKRRNRMASFRSSPANIAAVSEIA